jgi:hypothetical protein
MHRWHDFWDGRLRVKISWHTAHGRSPYSFVLANEAFSLSQSNLAWTTFLSLPLASYILTSRNELKSF